MCVVHTTGCPAQYLSNVANVHEFLQHSDTMPPLSLEEGVLDTERYWEADRFVSLGTRPETITAV